MQGGVADNEKLDTPEVVLEEDLSGPPKATLNRRAQSYTDFHHAARAVLPEGELHDGWNFDNMGLDLEVKKSREPAIADDTTFARWYQNIENELLESSHDDYTYALRCFR